MTDYLAVGNDELRDSVKEGDWVVNESKSMYGAVQYGTDSEGNKTSLLGFIEYKDSHYLVSIENKLFGDWKVVND